MLSYILRRLATSIPTLFLVVTIAFFLVRVAPGGPFDREKPIPPEIKRNMERSFGLDQPLIVQYGIYLKHLAQGDLGPSYIMPQFTVRDLFAAGLPVSIRLGAQALILALLLGGALGVVAALYQNKPPDYAVIATATAGSTIPNFVVAPLIQLVFALWLKWLPVGGWQGGAFVNTVGPIITLALPQLAVVARLMRGSMIESLRSNHIRTARAMGLSQFSVVVKHAMRGAILPIVSYAGPATAGLVTGSIIVESIFQIPGVGRYFIEGAINRDYTLVMGTVVMIAVFTILFNLVVDILYAFIDPRVRYD